MKFNPVEFYEKRVQTVRLLCRSEHCNENHAWRPTYLAGCMSFNTYRTEKCFTVRVKDRSVYPVCVTHVLLSEVLLFMRTFKKS